MALKDIIYGKKSLGKDWKEITIYKIRTMYIGAEKDMIEMISKNGFDENCKIKNDPRVTNIGKILRKYWVDELPQIYNLFKGDIGIVGIRATSKKTFHLFPEDIQKERMKYKPGLFGVYYIHKEKSNFGGYIRILKKYLKEKRKNHITTDTKYLIKILSNILFKGVRSK